MIADGALVGGTIALTAGGPGVTPSYENSYDAAGHVVSVESLGGTSGTDLMAQRFAYDLRGERTASWYAVDLTAGPTDNGIQSTQQYDAAGHVLATTQYFIQGATAKYYQAGDAVWNTVNIGGWLMSAQTTYYDADGRVIAQGSYARPTGGTPWYQLADQKILNGTLTVADEETVPNPLPGIGSLTYGQLDLQSETTGQSYDAEGNLGGYVYSLMGTGNFSYTVSYLKRDGYLEAQTSGTTTASGYTPAADTSIYDALGQRIAVQQTEQLPGGTVSSTTRVFSYDGDGQILSRTDGTVSGTGASATFTALSGATPANPDALAPQHYVYAEGHQIATLSEAGTIQTRDGLTPYSDPQSSGSYTVQAGDTLQGIAQTVYGNASLWYVIADANAISLDSSGNAINLIAGTTLKLPAVSNSQNSSQTFTPYNPLKLIGSTTPALAYIPPPPQHHCNDLTTLIVVAVTIAVTVYTAGAAAEELGAVAASGLGLPSSNDQRMGLGQGFLADLAGGVLDGGGDTRSLAGPGRLPRAELDVDWRGCLR